MLNDAAFTLRLSKFTDNLEQCDIPYSKVQCVACCTAHTKGSADTSIFALKHTD